MPPSPWQSRTPTRRRSSYPSSTRRSTLPPPPRCSKRRSASPLGRGRHGGGGPSISGLPENPIDRIWTHFGADRVAELTGRSRRRVRDAQARCVPNEPMRAAAAFRPASGTSQSAGRRAGISPHDAADGSRGAPTWSCRSAEDPSAADGRRTGPATRTRPTYVLITTDAWLRPACQRSGRQAAQPSARESDRKLPSPSDHLMDGVNAAKNEPHWRWPHAWRSTDAGEADAIPRPASSTATTTPGGAGQGGTSRARTHWTASEQRQRLSAFSRLMWACWCEAGRQIHTPHWCLPKRVRTLLLAPVRGRLATR